MANLSQHKREKMLSFLDTLKEENANNDEALRALGEIESELNSKKYGLVWEKHEERVDRMMKDNIPVFTENHSKEIKAASDGNYNFLLEGDNLHSLKLLEKTHREKIDVIYIDPPYNTGKKDNFKYDDQWVDDKDTFKHSKWLSFMSERLQLAYKLLSPKGIIMISIDENEEAQLKMLCDEVFGEENRLSTHHIQVRYTNKNLNEDNDWHPVMEYVFIYAKNKNLFKANKPAQPYDLSTFCWKITELTKGQEIHVGGKKVTVFKDGEWKIEKMPQGEIGLLKETWASGSLVRQSGTAAQFLERYLLDRKSIDGLNVLYKIDNMGEDGLGYRYVSGPKKATAIRGKYYSGVPLDRIEELKKGVSKKTHPIPNLINYAADFGNISKEGGMPFNGGKKPVKMLKEFINYHTNKNALILDFFAGSGSTGQAVLELNNDDGGKRHFILCTNNENKICENITYQRLRNVITGKKADGSKYSDGLPANLKYYKTDFVSKHSDDVSDELMNHIAEMIQLEHGISIDNKKYVMILSDDDADDLQQNWSEYKDLKGIYKVRGVMLTGEQEELFALVPQYDIPDYYFNFELKEVGEAW